MELRRISFGRKGAPCWLLLAALLPLGSSMALADTEYYRHAIFDNSLTPDAYFYSSAIANGHSFVEQSNSRLPVETKIFRTPPNALRLQWRSEKDGRWEAEVRVMLTGFRPFQGNSAQTVCFKVMNVEPVPVSSLQADLPPELDRIVQRAIAKDPKDRYQSGAELAGDLRAFAASDDSFAEATRFLTRVLEHEKSLARRPLRLVFTRRMAVEAMIAIVAIALVFTGIEFRDQYREAEALFPPPPPVLHGSRRAK